MHGPSANLAAHSWNKGPRLQLVCEVSDGLVAVQKAEELKPDLILLDIGLPTLNGFEAARRILGLAPESKIIFSSLHASADFVREARSLGAWGYVYKTQAGVDLLVAVDAVLSSKRFVSGRGGLTDCVALLDRSIATSVRSI
jgi:DNA-binding NarL/FixJ family response regulator